MSAEEMEIVILKFAEKLNLNGCELGRSNRKEIIGMGEDINKIGKKFDKYFNKANLLLVGTLLTLITNLVVLLVKN